MKKAIFCVFVFLALQPFSGSAQEQKVVVKNTTGAQIKFLYGTNTIDFDRVPVNASLTYQFKFKNSGDEPLIIDEMHYDTIMNHSKISITWSKTPIKPGKTSMITLIYKSNEQTGSFKNEIFINSNATAANYPLLHISGAIVPASEKYSKKYEPFTSNYGGGELSSEGSVFAIVAMSVISIITEENNK